jgi:hypothetical protein
MPKYTMTSLPILSLSGAVTLSLLLEQAAAAESKLSASVNSALADTASARQAAQEALAGEAPADPASVRPAELVVDQHWKLVRDYLQVWADLGVDESAQAQSALDSVFGADGLAFTKLRAEEQLTESAARLQRPELEATLKALGGEPFFTELQAAHEGFEQAVMKAPSAKLDKTSLLADLKDAMQTYVTRVQATIDRKDQSTADRATRLLQPIPDWKAKTAREKKAPVKPKPTPQPAPTPAPVPAPAPSNGKQ